MNDGRLDRTLHQKVLAQRNTFDHADCGDDVHSSIQGALDCIGSAQSHQASSSDVSDRIDQAIRRVEQVARESHARMTGVHHSQVERRWRRAYTDSMLLKALLVLRQASLLEDDTRVRTICLDAIHDADLAIVIAGACGPDRLEWLHEGISALQGYVPVTCQNRAGRREETQSPLVPKPPLKESAFAMSSVPCLVEMPGLLQYLNSCGKAFVVSGGALDWPAFVRQTGDERLRCKWASASYLESIAGPGRVVPVEIGRDYTHHQWTQALVSWQDFLSRCRWGCDEKDGTHKHGETHYLAQHNLFNQFPALRYDTAPIDLIYSFPPAPPSCPSYAPPLDEDGAETALYNTWIGPAGTLTPIHKDPYFNCYVQVVGSKHVWIGDPGLTESELHSVDGTANSVDLFEGRDATRQYDEHQLAVFAKSQHVILMPGDVLFMPPGWFHSLKSLTKSFSVSMWY